MLKDCPRTHNLAKAATRRLEYPQKKRANNSVHLVLAELCHQMDDHDVEVKAEDAIDDRDDVDIFQHLVTKLGESDDTREGNDDEDSADILIMKCEFSGDAPMNGSFQDRSLTLVLNLP